MKNCLVCDRDLSKAVRSAKKTNGEFYLMCNSCGNVHYVTVDANGLTNLERTKTGENPETMNQMMEAARLFARAGVSITGFKSDVHTEKKDSTELDPEKAKFMETTKALGLTEKTGLTLEELWEDYNAYKEEHHHDPALMLKSLLGKIMGLTDRDEEECDCDNCEYYDECGVYDEEDEEDECDYDCDDCCGCDDNEDECDCESLIKALKDGKKFVALIETPEGVTHEVTADSEEDVAEMFAELNNRNIKVKELYEVKLERKKIKEEVTTKITIE